MSEDISGLFRVTSYILTIVRLILPSVDTVANQGYLAEGHGPARH